MQHRQRGRRVEVVFERSDERVPPLVLERRCLERERVPQRVATRSRLRHQLIREVDRLAPRRGEEEDEDRLAAPLVEHLADRPEVAERLRHLGVADRAEHPVVRPDRRERMPERARLRDLVLVVREHEVEAAAVDLERRPVDLLGHHRALDVPARPAAPPRRVPPRVLGRGLVRLPESEVARVALERARLLALLDLVGLLPREPAVLREALDAEVDVAAALVGIPARDQLFDERDDLRHRVGRLRQVVGHAEAEVAGVLEIPLGRVGGELRARAGRGVVDLVVDVRDVVDELRVVPARREATTAATSRRRTAARCRCAHARRPSARRSTSGSGRAAAAARRATARTCRRDAPLGG